MTAQFSERLLHGGEILRLCSTPLDSYLKQKDAHDIFRVSCTANWRGYVGSWELVEDKLYLVELSGTLKDGTPASLNGVFPGQTDRVFAEWYTGTLRVPDGELLEYVHLGFASRHERDLMLEIVDGVHVGTVLQDNNAAEAAPMPAQRVNPKRPGLINRLFRPFW